MYPSGRAVAIGMHREPDGTHTVVLSAVTDATPTTALDLTDHLIGVLLADGLRTAGDIHSTPDADLLDLRGVGEGRLAQIRSATRNVGGSRFATIRSATR